MDLRLNPEKGISAAERLKDISQAELEGMLMENSDEPYAREISMAILSEQRKGHVIDTTTKLKKSLKRPLSVFKRRAKEAVKKSCARTFQAAH